MQNVELKILVKNVSESNFFQNILFIQIYSGIPLQNTKKVLSTSVYYSFINTEVMKYANNSQDVQFLKEI